MGPIEQELENFKTKLQEEMDKPEAERNQDQINFYTNTIASLELQLGEQEKHIQQHEERVQKQAEQISSISQQIQELDIFGAILPEEPFAKIIGITEYNEKRQELNQFLHVWETENQTAIISQHNDEVAQFQSTIRDLKAQLHTTETERDNAIKSGKDDAARLTEANAENARLQQALDQANQKADEDKAQADKTISELNAKVEELQQKLDEANKPKITVPASQSIQDRLNEIRDKSIKSAKDLALGGNTFRGKVIFEAGQKIEAPALPPIVFPSEEVAQEGATFSDAQPESGELPAAEMVETVGATFQGEVSTVLPDQSGDSTSSEVEGQAPKSIEEILTEHREQIETLKGRVDHLYRQANISEVA